MLLATGYSQSADDLGEEFALLKKPYQLADLSRAVGALLDRAQARAAPAG